MKTAVILAGGKSSRMGFDKQLLEIDNRRLIVNQVEILSEVFDRFIIISNNDLLNQVSFNVEVKIMSDIIPECGPLGGIYTAMTLCKEPFYVIACDMPNINLNYIDYLKSFIHCDAVITRKGDWIEPFNSFYHPRLMKSLELFLKNNKRNIYEFLKGHNVHYVSESKAREFDLSWSMFKNINYIDDLNTKDSSTSM